MKKALSGVSLIFLVVLFGSICLAEDVVKITDNQVKVYLNNDSYQPSEVIAEVMLGESYAILDQKTDELVGLRYKIKLPNGQQGWVSAIYSEIKGLDKPKDEIKDINKAKELYKKAYGFYSEENYEEALENYQSAQSMGFDNAKVRFWIAKSMVKLGRKETAFGVLEEANILYPADENINSMIQIMGKEREKERIAKAKEEAIEQKKRNKETKIIIKKLAEITKWNTYEDVVKVLGEPDKTTYRKITTSYNEPKYDANHVIVGVSQVPKSTLIGNGGAALWLIGNEDRVTIYFAKNGNRVGVISVNGNRGYKNYAGWNYESGASVLYEELPCFSPFDKRDYFD